MISDMEKLKFKFGYEQYFYKNTEEYTIQYFIPYELLMEVLSKVLDLRREFTFNVYVMIPQTDTEIILIFEHVSGG